MGPRSHSRRSPPWPTISAVKRLLGIIALTLVAAAPRATAQDDQDLPQPVFYELLPANGSYPIARVCYTDEGICALPLTVPPGRPCECRRPDRTWVSGVCTH